jgi:hypothetical protein
MTIAVLRVAGELLGGDPGIAAILGAPETSWRAGEPRVGGRVSTTSGFTFLLSQGEDSKVVVENAAARFLAVADLVGPLTQAGAEAEVDFGITMEADDPMKSITLGDDFLGALSGVRVSVIFSVYPCSE